VAALTAKAVSIADDIVLTDEQESAYQQTARRINPISLVQVDWIGCGQQPGMATSEPDEGGVTTYRFRCCERCGGQANEHPVRHIEPHLHRDARVRLFSRR
jgi:hypothetical protein